MDNRVPVVVVYRGGNGALAIARTLGRMGVPMYLVSQTGPCTVWHSRYWKKKFVWDFSAPADASVEFLLKVARSIGQRPILLTLADWLAIFIEQHAEELKTAYRFPKASPPLIHALSDKWRMFLLAKEYGIPTPETAYPRSAAEALQFASEIGYPIVMKGADPLKPNVANKRILQNAEELLAEYSGAEPPNAVLQEYIPGTAADVWMCNAYFGSGSECKAAYTGRKLRQVSATGVASIGVCLPCEPVARSSIRFMQAVGYEGVLDVGFRYDARDGQYKVLDVNPRVGGAFRLFRATNGLDVVRACYFDLTGRPVPRSELAVERKWMLEDDFFAARADGLSFTQWLRSLRGVRETHWFAFDDPLPGFVWAWGQFTARARSSIARRARQSFGGKRYAGGGTTGDPTSSTIC